MGADQVARKSLGLLGSWGRGLGVEAGVGGASTAQGQRHLYSQLASLAKSEGPLLCSKTSDLGCSHSEPQFSSHGVIITLPST